MHTRDQTNVVPDFRSPARPSRRLLLSLVLGLPVGVSACSVTVTEHTIGDDSETSTSDGGAPTTSTDGGSIADGGDPLRSVDGVWLERGYARALRFSPSGVDEYHLTEVSCTPVGSTSRDEVLAAHDRIELTDDTLSWFQKDHFTRHEFDRASALPDACDAATQPDAPQVYDAFWHLFQENYAYFEVRGVDWDKIYQTHAQTLDASSSDDELMTALSESIAPLDDGHVYVFDGVSRGFMSGDLGELWQHWASQYDGEPVTNPINPRGDFILDMQEHVKNDILAGRGKTAIHDLLQWGYVEEGIGYLDLHEFYYPFEEEPSIAEIQSMVDAAMREVVRDFADADALIVDIRFNQGGSDSMGYAIMSWLTDRDVLVARKRAAYRGGWTTLQDVHVSPRDTAYFDKPIVLLQSGNSISAAETFAMAMNELPQVVSVGARSYGVFSDVLQRVLPNGWIVALSNEVYEAPNGAVYEAVGVPVDIEVPYDDSSSFYENLDATFERALQQLRPHVAR